MILGAVIGGVVGGFMLFYLAAAAKKMVPQAKEALATRKDGMTMEELGEAVGLAGTFQRGKLQQLCNHLVADGVEMTTEGGVTRYRVKA